MGKMSTGGKVAIAAGVGLLAGAVAGVLFAPKSGKETREDIKKAAMGFKDKVAKKSSEVSDLTKKKYDQIVDKVASEYESAKKFSKEDLKELVADVKDRWADVEKEVAKHKKS